MAKIEIDADEVKLLVTAIRGVLEVGERIGREMDRQLFSMRDLATVLTGVMIVLERIERKAREAEILVDKGG